jgi:hypothetical protein
LRHAQKAFPIGKSKPADQEPIPTPQVLFSQWLKQSPEVELWKQYLEYVRSNQSSPRDVIKKAYEFALRFVGQDRDAGEIWKDYIEYIKADPTSNERESQEKMDLLRGVYRRAVQIPLDNLEQIWREWDAFENGLNKLTVGIKIPSLVFTARLANTIGPPKFCSPKFRFIFPSFGVRQCKTHVSTGQEIFSRR